MIDIQNLRFHYPNGRHRVFEDFSLQLQGNRIYGLLGVNGTGKSTLLYLLSGLLRPQQGHVRINGMEACRRHPDMLREVFIVPEEYDLPDISLKHYVEMNSMFYPRFSEATLRSCLDAFELSGDLQLKHLSLGQKKKVYMSMALATNTRLLLMDEPTNGLDIPSKSLFRKVVADNMSDDRLVIISTHQVHDIASLLDHVLMLSTDGLILNAGIDTIADHYAFGMRHASEMTGDELYAEPTLQGNAVVLPRKDGDAETPVNLELLFNAAVKGLIKL